MVMFPATRADTYLFFPLSSLSLIPDWPPFPMPATAAWFLWLCEVCHPWKAPSPLRLTAHALVTTGSSLGTVSGEAEVQARSCGWLRMWCAADP